MNLIYQPTAPTPTPAAHPFPKLHTRIKPIETRTQRAYHGTEERIVAEVFTKFPVAQRHTQLEAFADIHIQVHAGK